MSVVSVKSVTLYSLPYAAVLAGTLVAAESFLPAQDLSRSQGYQRAAITVTVNRAAKRDRLPIRHPSPINERPRNSNIVVTPETA
jgi:hypothetical protein